MKGKTIKFKRWMLLASGLFLVVLLLLTSYYYLFLKSRPESNNQADNFTTDSSSSTDQSGDNGTTDSSGTTEVNSNFDNKGQQTGDVPEVNLGEAITLYEQGNNLYTQKKLEEAIVYYNRAIQASPYYPVIYNKKAQVLFELNRKNEALDTLLNGLENNPDDPQLLSTYEIINAK